MSNHSVVCASLAAVFCFIISSSGLKFRKFNSFYHLYFGHFHLTQSVSQIAANSISFLVNFAADSFPKCTVGDDKCFSSRAHIFDGAFDG